MTRLLSTFLILLFSISSFAQEQFRIKGKVKDQLDIPLFDASVLIGNSADSTQIKQTFTDVNGLFNLSLNSIETPFYIIIEDPIEGFYKRSFENLNQDLDLGTIILSPQTYQLKEVILSTTSPVVIKNDTIEFDANSFKVKPNANLEALLRELPGVDIDDNGKITVNGKDVNEILIDGEPFFGTDGKVALENLPADIIKKVQVSDFKTKNEKFSGERSRSDKSSINITLKEDKKMGYMIKGTAGFGTDNRYEGNLMANYFKGSKKLSLIASSNDIASTGLATGAGSFGRGGMGKRGSNGITNSSNIGLNYNDKINDNLTIGGSYNYNNSYNKNDNYTRQENLLPNNVYTTESNTKSKTTNNSNQLSTNLEWTKNQTKIYFSPSYNYSTSNSSKTYDGLSIDEAGNLRNENFGQNRSDSKSNTFNSNLNLYQGFKNKSYFNLSANLNLGDTDQNNFINSSTLFYTGNTANDIRNQFEKVKSINNALTAELNYTLPITDSLKVAVGGGYNYNKLKNDNVTWNYDELTGEYLVENSALTRFTETNLNTFTPYAEIILNKSKLSASFRAGSSIYNQKNYGLYQGTAYQLKTNEALPLLKANLRYTLGNSSLAFNYNYVTSLASTTQLLAIENLSNPLNIFIGNPDLNPNKAHQLNFNFSNFDRKTRQGVNANLSYVYNTSSIVSRSSVDENLITRSTYTNVEGNYRLNGNLIWSKQLNKSNNKLNLNVGINAGYGRQQGFRNSILYTAYNSTITPNVRLTYSWNDYITLSPSYNLMFSNSKYDNYTIDKQSNTVHNIGLRTITTWPQRLTWTNDFSYNNNSRLAAGFKRDFFLWNTQIMYSFYQKKFEAGVKIYDILNQNNSYTRTISDEYVRDERNNILTRFIMFSLTFNLNQFGGKNSGSNQNFDRPRDGGNRGGMGRQSF